MFSYTIFEIVYFWLTFSPIFGCRYAFLKTEKSIYILVIDYRFEIKVEHT